MPRKQQFTAQQVADSIFRNNGYVSKAAAELNVSTQTIYNYRDKYAAVRQAMEETKTKRDDYVENKLMQAIDADNVTAIIFYLKTQAKHRGYVERQEIRPVVDVTKLSDNELQALVEG